MWCNTALKVDRGDGFGVLLRLLATGENSLATDKGKKSTGVARGMFGFCSVPNRGRSLGTVWTV